MFPFIPLACKIKSIELVVWDMTDDLSEDIAITVYSPWFLGKHLIGGGFTLYIYIYNFFS